LTGETPGFQDHAVIAVLEFLCYTTQFISSYCTGLSSQTQPFDQACIAGGILLPKVVQQLAPLIHHADQTAPRMVILLIGTEMLLQRVDVRREERNLDLGDRCRLLTIDTLPTFALLAHSVPFPTFSEYAL
jgi:hypothetical protein